MAGPDEGEGVLVLQLDGEGLSLHKGDMAVRGDFARMANRTRTANLRRELLVRAAKVHADGRAPRAVDATAGLGDDSWLLAAAGFEVVMFERNPVIAALLRDALARAHADPSLSPIASRMHVEEGDSEEGLRGLSQQPDVVLLDPMFPEKRKPASAKKKLQLLQALERPCDDEALLLDAAFAAHPRKIVVKRPVKGPHLARRKPDYSLLGKAIRYDCFSLGA